MGSLAMSCEISMVARRDDTRPRANEHMVVVAHKDKPKDLDVVLVGIPGQKPQDDFSHLGGGQKEELLPLRRGDDALGASL